MGYHLRKIEKRQVGTIEKIIEEVEEYQDAMEQGCKVMALVELCDIYGALEMVAEKHNLTMDDLKSMAKITRRAFEDGSRKSTEVPYTSILKHQESEFNDTESEDKINGVNSIIAEFNAYDKDLSFEKDSKTVGVSVTHIPTGLIAFGYDYPNLIANKEQALRNLAELLYDHRQLLKLKDIKLKFKIPSIKLHVD